MGGGPIVAPLSLARSEAVGRPDYENEAVFRRGTLPHRTHYLPPDATLLLNGEWEFHYAHAPVAAPDAAVVSAPAAPDADVTWSPITVPGHWQLEGRHRGHGEAWGVPNYTNVQYPFPVEPPYVPAQNPTGTYRRTFAVPPEWTKTLGADAKLRLRFDGVDSAYHVWVNGALVGYAQGSRNAAEYDITEHVAASPTPEITLVVQVYQWSDGSYIEDQDQWWLSGIFRDVTLIGFPGNAAIEDWFITTDLDATYTDATVHARVTIRVGDSVFCRGTPTLTMRMKPPGGRGAAADDAWAHTASVEVSTASEPIDLKMELTNPPKWTAETPDLYEVVLELAWLGLAGANDEETSHVVRQKIGIRQVEMIDGLLCVNGTALRLRGANRHDHHPLHGRAVPHAFMVADLEQMKRFNLNALRCSHYPPPPALLEAADELGLWVMDEADLECHGFYDAVARPLDIPEDMDYEERKKLAFPLAAKYTSDNPAWRDAYVDRMEAMVQRDKNHACVIVWSLGNEAFYGDNHKAMYHYAKTFDPGRPVHYEGDQRAETADMFSYMYPSVERLAKLAATDGVADDGTYTKPVILCEYAHAMGNSPGGLADYEALFRATPRIQGGFIWEWASHGLWKGAPTDDGLGAIRGPGDYYAYGGDFGDVPNDGTFVMDGLCRSDHAPQPGLVELKTVVQPVHMALADDGVTLQLQNLYDFIDLSHLALTYSVHEYAPAKKVLHHTAPIDLPLIGPHATGTVTLGFTQLPARDGADVLLQVFLVKKKPAPTDTTFDRIVAQYQTFLAPQAKHKLGLLPSPYRNTLTLAADARFAQATVAGVTTYRFGPSALVIDESLGYVTQWTVGPLTVLKTTPETGRPAIAPGFWRAPTDNDRPVSDPYWRRFGVDDLRLHRVQGLTVQTPDDEAEAGHGHLVVTIDTVVAPPVLDWGWNCRTVYTLEAAGTLHVACTFAPFGSAPKHVPRIGLDLGVAKDLAATFAWYGKGPGESYPDKETSQLVDVYASDLTGLSVPYDVPQESGNRMGTGWVVVADADRKTGVRVALSPLVDQPHLATGFSWSAHPFTPQQVDAARHPCDLLGAALKETTILRLDARVAGVGSQACGPPVREDLLGTVETTSFAFSLSPFPVTSYMTNDE